MRRNVTWLMVLVVPCGLGRADGLDRVALLERLVRPTLSLRQLAVISDASIRAALGDPVADIVAARAALAKSPGDGEAHLNLAVALVRGDRMPEANAEYGRGETIFRARLRADAHDWRAHYGYGACLGGRGGSLSEAMEHLGKAADGEPTFWPAMTRYAETAMSAMWRRATAGDATGAAALADDAKRHAAQAKAVAPERPEPYLTSALVLLSSGTVGHTGTWDLQTTDTWVGDMIADLRAATRHLVRPARLQVLTSGFEIVVVSRELDGGPRFDSPGSLTPEAVDRVQRAEVEATAATADPAAAEQAWAVLAMVSMLKGERAGFAERCRKSSEANPRGLAGLETRLMAAVMDEDWGEAERATAAMLSRVDSAHVRCMCAQVAASQGEWAVAARHYRVAVTKPDAGADAWCGLGFAILKCGENPVGAVAPLRKSVSLKADDLAANADLGIALALTGDLAGARKSLERAHELAPDNRDIGAALGLLPD